MKLYLLKVKIRVFFHTLKAIYWNWRLPLDIIELYNEWVKIDHRKDKSLSGRDFRLWVYLRKLNPKPKRKSILIIVFNK